MSHHGQQMIALAGILTIFAQSEIDGVFDFSGVFLIEALKSLQGDHEVGWCFGYLLASFCFGSDATLSAVYFCFKNFFRKVAIKTALKAILLNFYGQF